MSSGSLRRNAIFLCAAILVLLPAALSSSLLAQQTPAFHGKKGRETGLPIPRFVSLKARQARMRVGPSTEYATKWVYLAPGLPFEILEEYGHWRQVRDYDGISGWMSAALLSGQRTATVGPWLKEAVPLRDGPYPEAAIAAKLGPRVLLHITSCTGKWCKVSVQKQSLAGYVRQDELWGAYPGEEI